MDDKEKLAIVTELKRLCDKVELIEKAETGCWKMRIEVGGEVFTVKSRGTEGFSLCNDRLADQSSEFVYESIHTAMLNNSICYADRWNTSLKEALAAIADDQEPHHLS